MAGPRYYFDPDNPSATKFPEEFDGKWFIAEWNNDWIKTAELDEDGNASNVEDFARPRLPEPDGHGVRARRLAVRGGVGPGLRARTTRSPASTGSTHVELTGPQVTASADPDRGTVPLEVAFDGEATNPDGSPNPDFEYEWDFGDGSPVSTEPDPTHTYTEVGEYTATLTVTDPETEEQGTATVEINVNEPSECPTGPLSDEFDGDCDRLQVDDHQAGQHATADGLGRRASLPDRQRLDLRARDVGAEHHGPAAARR